MGEFFDLLDSGVHDRVILIVVGLLFIASSVWARIARRRSAKERFFEAQAKAQMAYEKHGGDHVTTQLAVMEALATWTEWQQKPLPSLPAGAESRSSDEWDAISLLQSLPEDPPERRVS